MGFGNGLGSGFIVMGSPWLGMPLREASSMKPTLSQGGCGDSQHGSVWPGKPGCAMLTHATWSAPALGLYCWFRLDSQSVVCTALTLWFSTLAALRKPLRMWGPFQVNQTTPRLSAAHRRQRGKGLPLFAGRHLSYVVRSLWVTPSNLSCPQQSP